MAVNPWIGVEGERGRRAGPDGTADGVHRRAWIDHRREGAVPRVWRMATWTRRSRSGRRGTRTTTRSSSRRPGRVVDGGLLGITGNIGWFVPSYVVDEHPEYATWRASTTTPTIFATADTGRQRPVPRRATRRYSIFDEQIIAALGLDLEVIYSGSEDASLSALDTACQNEEPILMYWWTPQWANAKYDLVEVELPAFDDQCADIALNEPRPSATTATTPPTSCTRRSAPSWRRRTRRVRVPVEHRATRPQTTRTGGPRDPGRRGARGGRAGMGGREPGRLASLAARRPDRAFEDDARGRPRGPPLAFGGESLSEHVRMWVDGGWRLSELKTIVGHVG